MDATLRGPATSPQIPRQAKDAADPQNQADVTKIMPYTKVVVMRLSTCTKVQAPNKVCGGTGSLSCQLIVRTCVADDTPPQHSPARRIQVDTEETPAITSEHSVVYAWDRADRPGGNCDSDR
jgi:hypothetical protein